MLCLVNISNCVLMECGHSSICFDCTMHLAINCRAQGKPPYCHLCRKLIKFALKIEVPAERLEYSPGDEDDCCKKKVFSKDKQNPEKFVRILSFVDMTESKFRGGQRRRKFPKFREKIITDETLWIVDNSDFNGLMNEFRF